MTIERQLYTEVNESRYSQVSAVTSACFVGSAAFKQFDPSTASSFFTSLNSLAFCDRSAFKSLDTSMVTFSIEDELQDSASSKPTVGCALDSGDNRIIGRKTTVATKLGMNSLNIIA